MNFSVMSDPAILAEVGRRLRRERLNADLGQAELAAHTGLSRKTVQNAEAGKNPSIETVIRMLRGLNLLHQFDAFLPDPGLSPLQLAKLKGKTRQRASGSRSGTSTTGATKDDDWQW